MNYFLVNIRRLLFFILALMCAVIVFSYSLPHYSPLRQYLSSDCILFDIAFRGFFIFMGLHCLFVANSKWLGAFFFIIPALFWMQPKFCVILGLNP